MRCLFDARSRTPAYPAHKQGSSHEEADVLFPKLPGVTLRLTVPAAILPYPAYVPPARKDPDASL